MPKLESELTQFMGAFMFNGIYDLAQEAKELGIPLKQVSKVLEPKVTRLSRQGIGVETFVDHEVLETVMAEPAKKETDANRYDIMHG